MGGCAGKVYRQPNKFALEKNKLSRENMNPLSARLHDPFTPESMHLWQKIVGQFEEASQREFLMNAYFLLLTERLESKLNAEELLSLILPIVINQRRTGTKPSRSRAIFRTSKNVSHVQLHTAARIAVELSLLKILNSPSTKNSHFEEFADSIYDYILAVIQF